MKKIILTTILVCSSLFGEIVLDQDLKQFELMDQFDKKHTISKDTKMLIFAYKKASGHTVKDFLASKPSDYLSSKSAYYIADVSAMPSFVRWFALGALDSYNYPILLIEDDEIAAQYKDEENIEKIKIVTLDNLKVVKVDYVENEKQLETILGE